MKTIAISSFILLMITTVGNAQEHEWETPIISGYGKIKDFKDAALQPDTSKIYKILYHITADKQKDGVNADLWHIARQVNLFGAAGVSKKNIQIVAVISGPATKMVMTEAAYQKKFNEQNPNKDIIQKLVAYGVELDVCGQALAEHDINHSTELDKNIKFTLSALIDIPLYQMKGYSVMF